MNKICNRSSSSMISLMLIAFCMVQATQQSSYLSSSCSSGMDVHCLSCSSKNSGECVLCKNQYKVSKNKTSCQWDKLYQFNPGAFLVSFLIFIVLFGLVIGLVVFLKNFKGGDQKVRNLSQSMISKEIMPREFTSDSNFRIKEVDSEEEKLE